MQVIKALVVDDVTWEGLVELGETESSIRLKLRCRIKREPMKQTEK